MKETESQMCLLHEENTLINKQLYSLIVWYTTACYYQHMGPQMKALTLEVTDTQPGQYECYSPRSLASWRVMVLIKFASLVFLSKVWCIKYE